MILISGPVALAAPRGVNRILVRTAEEMRAQVLPHFERATIAIQCAAVADFRVSRMARQKIKKNTASLSLELEPTPDILAELGRNKGERLLIGFAAETENLEREARRKLEAKNCDMIVGNLVGGPDIGFESDRNEVLLALRTGEVIRVAPASKREIAGRVLDAALRLRPALAASHGR